MTNFASQLGSIQTNLGLGVAQLGDKLDAVKDQIQEADTSNPTTQFTARGVLTTLQGIDDKVSSILTNRQRLLRHSGSTSRTHHDSCGHMKELLNDVSAKVDDIYDKMYVNEDGVVNSQGENEVISDDDYNFDQAIDQYAQRHSGQGHLDRHFFRLFRRIAAPFRKANKRLRDMEDARTSFEQIMTELSTLAESSVKDVDRKFSDFFNMTMEMFEHQHHQLEEYDQSFASLRQCCIGTNSDLSALRASVVPILNRMDTFMVSSVQSSELRDERQREQMRFDFNRVLAAIKTIDQGGGGNSDFIKGI